jgi:cytochrome c-type biogenesis protein CcmH/NrfF
MEIEKKLDKIIGILYDENLLHWKEIPTTDIIVFGKKKYDITWTDAEISYIMNILVNDGYVVMNPGDLDKMIVPTYSLTTKGIQLKRNGGFVRAKKNEYIKNLIIYVVPVLVLIISFTTVWDFCEKHFKSKEKVDKCCNNCFDNSDKINLKISSKINDKTNIDSTRLLNKIDKK